MRSAYLPRAFAPQRGVPKSPQILPNGPDQTGATSYLNCSIRPNAQTIDAHCSSANANCRTPPLPGTRQWRLRARNCCGSTRRRDQRDLTVLRVTRFDRPSLSMWKAVSAESTLGIWSVNWSGNSGISLPFLGSLRCHFFFSAV